MGSSIIKIFEGGGSEILQLFQSDCVECGGKIRAEPFIPLYIYWEEEEEDERARMEAFVAINWYCGWEQVRETATKTCTFS